MISQLIILCGRSGVGKSTIQARLCQSNRVDRMITTTTRPPRHGEVHGDDYYFISKSEFHELDFIFTSEIFDQCYGLQANEFRRIENTGAIATIVAAPQDLEPLIKRAEKVVIIHLTSSNYDRLMIDRQVARSRMQARADDEIDFSSRVSSLGIVETVDIDHKSIEQTVEYIISMLNEKGLHV